MRPVKQPANKALSLMRPNNANRRLNPHAPELYANPNKTVSLNSQPYSDLRGGVELSLEVI